MKVISGKGNVRINVSREKEVCCVDFCWSKEIWTRRPWCVCKFMFVELLDIDYCLYILDECTLGVPVVCNVMRKPGMAPMLRCLILALVAIY